MGCKFQCDNCGIVEPGIHIKEYIFSKPRTWFQRVIRGEGSRPGEQVEISVLVACSRNCQKSIDEKYPREKIELEVVKN